MKFGAVVNGGVYATPEAVIEVATVAEGLGFESLWTTEHVLVPLSYETVYPYDASGKMPGDTFADSPDPLVWLSFAAAHTRTIKLGTSVLVLPQRNPFILAKQVATLDKLSGGRVMLGIGIGWLEEEFQALGVPFRSRGSRTDDYIKVMRSLWQGEATSYKSQFVDVTDVVSLPRPVNGAVPIIVGGHSEAAARRAGRFGDGFFPLSGTVEEIERLITLMRQTAVESGRDAEAIEVTTAGFALIGPEPEQALEALATAGVNRVIAFALSPTVDGIAEELGGVATRFLANFGGS